MSYVAAGRQHLGVLLEIIEAPGGEVDSFAGGGGFDHAENIRALPSGHGDVRGHVTRTIRRSQFRTQELMSLHTDIVTNSAEDKEEIVRNFGSYKEIY
jgi:hypothetical protein